jgi:hypothetical protein
VSCFQSKCRFSSRFPIVGAALTQNHHTTSLCSESLEKGCIRERHNSQEHAYILFRAVGNFPTLNKTPLEVWPNWKFAAANSIHCHQKKKNWIRSIKADNNYTHTHLCCSRSVIIIHFTLENKAHWGNAAALVLTPTAESAFKSDYASTKSTFLRSGRARAHTLSVANKLPIEMSAHRANLKDQSQSIEHSRTRVVLYVCV